MSTNGDISYIILIYTDIQWGTYAQIGFNAGDGVRSFMLPSALTSQTVQIETMSNIGIPGVFIYRVDGTAIQDLEGICIHIFVWERLGEEAPPRHYKMIVIRYALCQ